jgi:hypothetical protein
MARTRKSAKRQSRTETSIGRLLSKSGKTVDALATHGRSLAIWQKLVAANPDLIDFQSNLAASHPERRSP